MEYKASLDIPAKIITVLIFLMLGFVVYTNSSLTRIPSWIGLLATLIFFIAFVVAFLFAPQKYLVKNGILVIIRQANKVNIPLADIREARLLVKGETGTMIRLWGSGGLFGYFGIFRSTRIGKMKLYTTRRNNRILITTVDDERIMISPDDVSILDALKR